MTDENRRRNISLEVEKALRDARSAARLMESESWDAAVSLAYYSAFHWAQALILTEGLQSRSHGGLVHLVNLHFVRTGLLSPELARYLGELQMERHDASYDATAVFTRDIALDAVDKAKRYGQAVEAVLRERGYMPA